MIGLTADSVRWSDGGKDVAQELFDGHIVKGYSLQEAIEQNIVRPFSYVCTIIGFNRMIQERVERLSNHVTSLASWYRFTPQAVDKGRR